MTSIRRPLTRNTNVPRLEEDFGTEGLAAEILAFLAGDPERLSRFFDLTGLTPSTLRGAAREAGFGRSLFDYIASDDRLFHAFAQDSGREPAHLETIRQRSAPNQGPDD